MAFQDKHASDLQGQIKETLLDPESFGIPLFNKFTVLEDHIDDREMGYTDNREVEKSNPVTRSLSELADVDKL